MNTLIVIAVVLAGSALCMALSRLLRSGAESRATRLGINALCLVLGAVLTVAGLKYIVPLFPDSGDSTEQVGSSDVAAPGDSVLEARIQSEVESVWRRYRAFALLEEANPAAAARVRAKLVDMTRFALQSGGGSRVEDMAEISEIVSEVTLPLIGTSSDEAVSHFTEVVLEHLRLLRDQDPKACLIFLFPRAFDGDVLPANLPGVDDARMFEVFAEVLDSALHSPQPLPAPGEADSALAEALDALLPKMEARHGGREPVVAAFAALSDLRLLPAANHAVVADVSIGMYEEILKLPLKHRSLALRQLFAAAQPAG